MLSTFLTCIGVAPVVTPMHRENIQDTIKKIAVLLLGMRTAYMRGFKAQTKRSKVRIVIVNKPAYTVV